MQVARQDRAQHHSIRAATERWPRPEPPLPADLRIGSTRAIFEPSTRCEMRAVIGRELVCSPFCLSFPCAAAAESGGGTWGGIQRREKAPTRWRWSSSHKTWKLMESPGFRFQLLFGNGKLDLAVRGPPKSRTLNITLLLQ